MTTAENTTERLAEDIAFERSWQNFDDLEWVEGDADLMWDPFLDEFYGVRR